MSVTQLMNADSHRQATAPQVMGVNGEEEDEEEEGEEE